MKHTIAILATIGTALAAPHLAVRQSNACFVIGNTALPQEIIDSVDALASTITCDTSSTTLSGVPDVSSNGVSFSSIDFSTSSQSPLAFALDTFATADPLASTDIGLFQDMLNTYLATEAGIRSVGGNLAIKVPKFFLQFQIARINEAMGTPSDAPGQNVEHQLGKVVKNAAGEDSALLDQVNALATQLS